MTIAETIAAELDKIGPQYPLHRRSRQLHRLEELAYEQVIADCIATDVIRGFCFHEDGSCITWDRNTGISTE